MAATLFAVNYLMSVAQFRSPGFRKLVSGEAEVLIRDGNARRAADEEGEDHPQRHRFVTPCEGDRRIDKVRLGYLEDDGEISALLYRDPEQTRTIPAFNGRRTSKSNLPAEQKTRNVGSVRFELTIDGSLRHASVLQRVITNQKTHFITRTTRPLEPVAIPD